jgi:hypothetical protein
MFCGKAVPKTGTAALQDLSTMIKQLRMVENTDEAELTRDDVLI